MSAEFPYDVFLSHNHADKPRVRRLAERLKAAGVRVWLDEWVIQAGDIIALKVDEGLEQSRVLLLCISPAALASGWVALERSTAVHRDPANAGRRFIPLLLGDCALPDTLRRYKVVDFREESDAAFAEVLAACRPEREAVQPAPQPKVQKKPIQKKTKPTKPPQETWPHINAGQRSRSAGKVDFPLGFRLLHQLVDSKGTICRICWSNSGKYVAAPSHDGTITVWDAEVGTKFVVLKGHKSAVYGVAWSPDDRTLASGSWDESVRLWDVKTGKGRFLAENCGAANALSWHSSGKMIAVGFEESRILILDPAQVAKTKELLGFNGNINNLAWSPNGELLAGASGDSTIRIWDRQSGRLRHTFRGHADWAFGISWNCDGTLIASASWDHTVRCWDMKSGHELCLLEGHTRKVTSCSFSPDGRVLASKSTDNTVRLWRCDRWEEVALLSEHSSGKNSPSLSFHPSKPILATLGDKDTSIRIWKLDVDTLLGTGRKTEYHRYTCAKVVLIGESTVGKTTLAHRLIEDRYVKTDSTHGMKVWRLDLPLSPDETLDREVLLWDLAGQMGYREIHQLYLDQTALALLLINPQKADPFAETGDWLEALRSAISQQESDRAVEKLLITTREDVGGITVGKGKIQRFLKHNGFRDWLPTSAKTGENCSDKKNKGKPSKLKQLIAGSIPWDKLPWTSTPRLLAELKNAVMAMRDESDIRLLRFSELAQRLEHALPGEKFAEADVRTAVTLLANHGLARPLKFGDLVLLRPDLINGYAGAVIRAARAHTDEIGCVLEADIYRPDFDFTGVERLKHRPDEELLLRALVQTFLDHSLCIAEETPHGRHLVFPSQYRREKDIPHEPDIFVSYTFSGEWQTVWTTLVVRLWYSQEFAHRELWRNAAEFESARKQTLGLKITKTGDGAATISLYFDAKVEDVLKVIFIEYVHRHLAKYACEVTRDRRYVCPDCGKPVKDLGAVRRRLEAKKDFVTCQECDAKVPFIDLIEQRLKSGPVARKILAMDEKTTRGLDTQALEQILIGHMMAIAGEANQIFRPVTMFDYGIDGEVEFKDNDGKASGKRIYIQLKSGNSYLRTRKGDGSEVFDVSNERHLEYWVNQPVDVYLVIRQTDELSGQQVIRWMNVTRYLKGRKDKKSRQIVFDGERLDMEAVWKARDAFFPTIKKL